MPILRRKVVTGAGGFIGRAVLGEFLQRGWRVDAVGRRGRGALGKADEEIVWHAADLLNHAQVDSLIERTSPGVLVHLAWETRHAESWSSPANRDWTAATLQLARSFAQHGGRRFVGLGSCAEYSWASAEDGALDERTTARQPSTVYGAAKNATFDLLSAYFAEQRVEFAWGRLFHPYGPGEDRPTLVPSVIKALLAGEAAPCTAGTQRRDFIYVEDAAAAIAALTESSAVGPFNIGTGIGSSVRDVVTNIGEIVGRPELVRLGALPPRPGEPASVVANIDRIKVETAWSPRVSLDEGIAKTIEWWRARRREPQPTPRGGAA